MGGLLNVGVRDFLAVLSRHVFPFSLWFFFFHQFSSVSQTGEWTKTWSRQFQSSRKTTLSAIVNVVVVVGKNTLLLLLRAVVLSCCCCCCCCFSFRSGRMNLWEWLSCLLCVQFKTIRGDGAGVSPHPCLSFVFAEAQISVVSFLFFFFFFFFFFFLLFFIFSTPFRPKSRDKTRRWHVRTNYRPSARRVKWPREEDTTNVKNLRQDIFSRLIIGQWWITDPKRDFFLQSTSEYPFHSQIDL